MNIEKSNTDALAVDTAAKSAPLNIVNPSPPIPFRCIFTSHDGRQVTISMPQDGMFQLTEWLIGLCHELGIPMEIERKGFKEA